MQYTFREFDMDPQQASVFHQSKWSIEHWEKVYATKVLEPANQKSCQHLGS